MATGQGCRASLPGKSAGQVCRASLPGKSAGQTAGQVCRASLTGKSAVRTNAGKNSLAAMGSKIYFFLNT
jgi:hypothetical protein